MSLQDIFATPIVPVVRVGDGVQYEGSLERRHGFYRVLAVMDDRLVLGRKDRAIVSNVRKTSVWRRSVCTTCDAQPTWDRAIIVGYDSDELINACIDCAQELSKK